MTLIVLWAIGAAVFALIFEKWREQRERTRARRLERQIKELERGRVMRIESWLASFKSGDKLNEQKEKKDDESPSA